jgi:hypothetical protein
MDKRRKPPDDDPDDPDDDDDEDQEDSFARHSSGRASDRRFLADLARLRAIRDEARSEYVRRLQTDYLRPASHTLRPTRRNAPARSPGRI